MDAHPAGNQSTADLTACDREPIHILGAVQPFGFLLALSADWLVVHVSENAPRWLGRKLDALLGAPLAAIFDEEAIHVIRGRVQMLRGSSNIERIFELALRGGGPAFDVAVHLSGQLIVIEAEPSAAENLSASDVVRSMIGRLQQTRDFDSFCRNAARQMRALTGFDRVMVYRFHHDHSGEVIAEAGRSDLEPFLGLRYPASDIPRQARALYERNWLRIIADVNAENVPVIPHLSPEGAPLDLSMSVLRSVSPVHLEYLRNMGVSASLSVSIMRGDRLWGLLVCHHMEPRHLSLERRTGAELFGQMFSWILESREHELEASYENKAREIHNRLMTTVVAGGAKLDTLAAILDELAGIIDCDGAGVWLDSKITLKGSTPTSEEFSVLIRFLNRTAISRPYGTSDIASVYEGGDAFAARAAGLLAIPISRAPRDYIVFFRREVARSVTWGGNPNKSALAGLGDGRISPRKSFESWREVVRGQSMPWTMAELRIAESLRVTLLEVILHLADTAEKERKLAQERQETLIAELNHRLRNIFSLIGGLIAQSRPDALNLEDFASVIGERVQALARAHDQITRTSSAPGSLRALIALEASAYLGRKADRVRLTGPEVLLDPLAFSTLALVVHELMTNSAKYGALSAPPGKIQVEWEFDAAERLVMLWRETGGPTVKAPTRQGFGTTIIHRSIPYELKGETEIRFLPGGVEGRFVIPAGLVRLGNSKEAAVTEAAAPARLDEVLLSGTALLVEDNMIIALESEDMLRRLGAERVDLAASVHDAMRLIQQAPPSFALLDLNLGAETSVAVAQHLASLGVPFVFATGYGENLRVPPELASAPVVRKPFTADNIQAVLVAMKGSEG